MSEQLMLQINVRDELITMVAEDRRVSEELAADGRLFEGYHPQMAEVHQRNGKRLGEIVDQIGWPGKTLVGKGGAEAAWLILQHDIANPKLQRHCLPLLREAAAKGEIPAWQMAMLDDRIRVLEGTPQVYGTQFDWDENGEMSPCPIANPEQVEVLRQSVGLMSLEEDIRQRRARILLSMEKPPQDLEARHKEMEEWARSVGWRDPKI